MSKKYPLLDDKEWLEEKYLVEELSADNIGKIIGCSQTPVYAALRCLGILIRSHKDYRPTEEAKRKISEAHKGENNPNFGKHFSEEHKRKISEALKGKKVSEETRRKLTEAGKRRHHTEETKTKMSDVKKGQVPWNKGKKLPEAKKGKNHPNYGKHHTEKTCEKIREAAKKSWRNLAYIKNVFDGLNTKPNNQEKKVGGILQKCLPEQYAYNGDFSCGITIGGKIPDFVNINGEKIVIEVFGPWHDEQYMKDHFGDDIPWKRTEFGTKAHYSQFGYKCVVFWQEDLEREDVEQFVLSVLKEEGVI